jgi:methionine aminopeptidase
MRKRNLVLLLAVAAPAVAVPISGCAPSVSVANSDLTVQCTETLVPLAQYVTNGDLVGTGRCTMTGVLHDTGRTTDYRVEDDATIHIRRVITFTKGTITFAIAIPLIGAGSEQWTITSGTKTYAKLHGRGYEVVDNYAASPAAFVLKGTVSPF